MKIRRPFLSIDEVKDFFKNPQALVREKDKSKRYSVAALWYLNQGQIRVIDPNTKEVQVWVKRAILNFFRTSRSFSTNSGCFEYHDKLPVKKRTSLKNVRVVPGAVIRYGSFLEPGTIVMPSFINIGAFIGAGTMIDTWATVGSCAQIGKNVHVSGGVGIGGVLEPEQAQPVIIEDGVFIGSRAIIVEGVRVGSEAVIGAGVVLTASTKIIDVRGLEPAVSTHIIPERTVVIPGTYSKKFQAGEYGVPCALIIGTRKSSTDLKTSLNDALRAYGVAS